MAIDLTQQRFFELMPQFSGINADGIALLTQELFMANLIVCCSKWGLKCEMGRALLVAHYLSQYLELLVEAELDPETGGGTEMITPRIAMEKVGEVETRFRAAASANNGSNENNDVNTQDMRTTLYGRRYLALLRSLGGILTNTSAAHI